jgi:hypothetical protein
MTTAAPAGADRTGGDGADRKGGGDAADSGGGRIFKSCKGVIVVGIAIAIFRTASLLSVVTACGCCCCESFVVLLLLVVVTAVAFAPMLLVADAAAVDVVDADAAAAAAVEDAAVDSDSDEDDTDDCSMVLPSLVVVSTPRRTATRHNNYDSNVNSTLSDPNETLSLSLLALPRSAASRRCRCWQEILMLMLCSSLCFVLYRF